MIPGSIVLLLILSHLLLHMDCHAVQMCDWPGVLYQSMLDSQAQPNWVNEISAKLSIVSVPVRAAEGHHQGADAEFASGKFLFAKVSVTGAL